MPSPSRPRRSRTRSYNRLFTTDSDWLFERLPLSEDDLVLDVAAGTGHVSRRMAPRVRAVIAVDATEAMLEAGRVEAKRAALRNIVFMRADAAALPFLDGSFDIVVSRFAVHHFEDPSEQLAEMRRCLRMGGRLAIADLIATPTPRSRPSRTGSSGCATPRTRGCSRSRSWPTSWAAPTSSSATSSASSGPWLEQTQTSPEARAEIREALEAELAGGPATGFRPRERRGPARASSTRSPRSSRAIRVSPQGTRGSRMPRRGPLWKLFQRYGERQVREYRRGGEERVNERMGFPVVILTTRGAKTGQTADVVPLGGFPDGENAWLVAATIGGSARHPAWFLNMAKHPDDIWLEVGTERFKVRGESLEGAERVEALARIAKVASRYGEYQEKTDREIPIVRLTREPPVSA